MIVREISSRRQAGCRIVSSFFLERHANSHNDSAENLASAGFQINHSTTIHHADPARHPHQRKFGIDLHFAKLRAETLETHLFVFLELELTVSRNRFRAGAVKRLA